MIPTVLGNELCDVRQELRDDIGILGNGDERGGSSCGRRKGCDGIDQRRCSLSRSAVGLMTIPPSPMALSGM